MTDKLKIETRDLGESCQVTSRICVNGKRRGCKSKLVNQLIDQHPLCSMSDDAICYWPSNLHSLKQPHGVWLCARGLTRKKVSLQNTREMLFVALRRHLETLLIILLLTSNETLEWEQSPSISSCLLFPFRLFRIYLT